MQRAGNTQRVIEGRILPSKVIDAQNLEERFGGYKLHEVVYRIECGGADLKMSKSLESGQK